MIEPKMICKRCSPPETMKELTHEWYCMACGYEIAKLNDEMSPRLQQKIIRQMKEYYSKKKLSLI